MPHIPIALPQTQHLTRTGLSLAPSSRVRLQRFGGLALALVCLVAGFALGRVSSTLQPDGTQAAWVGQAPYAIKLQANGLMRLPIDELGTTLQFARAPGGEFQQQLEGWQLRLRQVQQGSAQFDPASQRPVLVSAARHHVIKE